MDGKANAQSLGRREIVEGLDREFARLHFNSCALVDSTPADILYAASAQTEIASTGSRWSLPSGFTSQASVGESVLRCAAAVEQTFGGITANLWDDPFEWTLPEYLSTPAKINDHLAEVEAIRERAFSSFADDACLLKRVAVPSGEMRPLIDLLAETLLRAGDQQAQALVTLKSLSGISPPGFII